MSEKDLNEVLRDFESQLGFYNSRATENAEISLAGRPSELEKTLIFFSPLLLSFALALRIAKVTGEIGLERTSRDHQVAHQPSEDA